MEIEPPGRRRGRLKTIWMDAEKTLIGMELRCQMTTDDGEEPSMIAVTSDYDII